MSTAEAYNGAGGRRDPGVIGRMWAMIVKEFVQMRRDRMTFATMLFVPILQLTLFGFAINTDPKDLPTAVLVRDDGPLTRAVLSAMKNTDYFDFKRQVLFFWRDGALLRILPVSTGNGKKYCEEGICGVAVTPSGSS